VQSPTTLLWEKNTQLAFATPSRGKSAHGRRRHLVSALRRFLPEGAAGAGALVLASVLAYRLQWPWFKSAFVSVVTAGLALIAYRLALRAVRDAREAQSAILRMRRLYELTRRTLEMDLQEEPGARLASLVH